MTINRRRFIQTTAFVPVAASAAKDQTTRRLACNSWPFRGYFDTPQLKEFRDPKLPLLQQQDFPHFLADHFGIHNVEFLPQHFLDTEQPTLEKVIASLKSARSLCCNLMGVELPGNIFSRTIDHQAIASEAARWLHVAKELNSPSITIALGGELPTNAAIAAENLKPVVDQARAQGIAVLFHNDDMQRESAEILSAIVKTLGTPQTGTCPDFGNFATKSADYALQQLRMLAPFATTICHSKDGIAEKDKFYADNFPASMRIMSDAGFHGLYSLEFEGLGDALAGVRKLKELTEHFLLHPAA
jgi:sugar phosphate isomerase/epimerase